MCLSLDIDLKRNIPSSVAQLEQPSGKSCLKTLVHSKAERAAQLHQHQILASQFAFSPWECRVPKYRSVVDVLYATDADAGKSCTDASLYLLQIVMSVPYEDVCMSLDRNQFLLVHLVDVFFQLLSIVLVLRIA